MLRFEHLRQLIGPQIPERVDPDDDLFLDRYSRFLQSVIDGAIPAEALPLFSDHETWVIPKGESDFRPLGGVGVHRKLASTIALQDPSTQAFNKYFFKNLQFGMDRLGTEKIVHSFRIFLERHPESDVYAMDADNAFNRLCRLSALYEIMKAHPALFPLIYNPNLGPSSKTYLITCSIVSKSAPTFVSSMKHARRCCFASNFEIPSRNFWVPTQYFQEPSVSPCVTPSEVWTGWMPSSKP